MKKILFIGLLLISWSAKSQQAATSNNQTIEIGKLQLILQQLQASPGTSTVQLTCTTTSVTSTGSIASGSKGILLETSSDFSGIIDGNRFLGSGFMSMPISGGVIYPAVTYTISAGTLYIKKWN